MMLHFHRVLLPIALVVLGICASCIENNGCETTLSCAPDSGAANGSDDPANTASAGNTGGAVNTGDSSNTPTTPGPAGFGGDGVVGGTAGTQSESGGGGAGAGTNADGGGQGGSNTLGGAGNSLGGADGGGTTGEGGNAGGTIVIPIGPMCTGNANCLAPTPVCDTALERCVVCLTEDNSGCAAEAPHCVGDGNAESRCVACLTNDECPVETPLCDADGSCTGCAEEADCSAFAETLLCRDDGQCVACLSESDCPTTAPVCDDTGTCSGCGADPDCEHLAETPICDEPSGACVGCTENTECATTSASLCENQQCVGCTAPEDCSHLDGTPTCNTETAQCVECVQNSDCPIASASACIDNTCVPCTEDAQCEHLPGTTVCDTEASECVECTVNNESPCGANSCDPATLTCTNTERGSRSLCESCIADSECTGGDETDPTTRCVPMEYAGTPREGGYCLQRLSAGCPARVYKIPLVAISLSGAVEETYCGVSEDDVTCEAIRDLTDSIAYCVDGLDSQCGCDRDENGECISSGNGGLCEAVGVDVNRCTYACGLPEQCPVGTTCTGGMPWCH